MSILSLWQWWYTTGWMSAAKELIDLLKRQSQALSVPILLRTLFAPWKQTVNVAGSNTPIQVRLQWWVGNQVSRFIGFLIRVITLGLAALSMAATASAGVLLLVSWFFIPIATAVLLFWPVAILLSSVSGGV